MAILSARHRGRTEGPAPDGSPRWPKPIQIGPPIVPVVRIGDLTEAAKRQLWRGLKRTNPAEAQNLAALSADPIVAELVDQLDASLSVPLDDYRHYMQAGAAPSANKHKPNGKP